MYPTFTTKHNDNPNRFYAVPLIGFIAKLFMLIPVFIVMIFLGLAFFFLWNVNSLVILFTGKYWAAAYNFFLGFMRYTTKITLYMYGMSDKYPGFDLSVNESFKIDMPMPTAPNRVFAIPVIGLLIRIILLIPYSIYSSVISYASGIAVFFSWFPVLFMGRYPDTTHEISHDSIRLGLSSTAYIVGFADTYPSWKIDLKNHKTMKIVLIVLGALLFIMNSVNNATQKEEAKVGGYSEEEINQMLEEYNIPTPDAASLEEYQY